MRPFILVSLLFIAGALYIWQNSKQPEQIASIQVPEWRPVLRDIKKDADDLVNETMARIMPDNQNEKVETKASAHKKPSKPAITSVYELDLTLPTTVDSTVTPVTLPDDKKLILNPKEKPPGITVGGGINYDAENRANGANISITIPTG